MDPGLPGLQAHGLAGRVAELEDIEDVWPDPRHVLATAVAFFAHSLVGSRLRTADTLGKIRRYGFASVAESEAPTGLRNFLDQSN